MKKIIIGIGLILTIVITFVSVRRYIDYNSISSKNTRKIEHNLTQDITSEDCSISGNVSDLINIDYDKMFVFEPYQSIELMEKQIGFKYSKLQEGMSEGIINILFVKNNSAIAYLFGHPTSIGYYLDIPFGTYTKSQIDKMTFTMEVKGVGNSAGTPITYRYYKFTANNTETASSTSINQEKYEIVPGKIYNVLLREEFEKSDNNMAALVRVYMCYDGIKNQKFPYTDKIAIDAANSLFEVKERLISQSDRKALQLRPYTIVSSEVLKQWEKEGYSPVYEYYKECPEGLTYENILKK